MVLRKVTILRLLLVSIILTVAVSGCAGLRDVTLYVIEKTDIFKVEAGSIVTHPDGTQTTVEKDGRFLSDFYIKEVAKARIGN